MHITDSWQRIASFTILSLMMLMFAGCATQGQPNPDPLEPVNRVVYKFNDKADHYVVRPTASAYAKVTPDPVQRSVRNFFNNLYEPVTSVNDLLQANFKETASDVGRFGINTTVGVLGLFDVASKWGLQRREQDFGLTLGKWGVGPGWYLVLPLLGPSTVRDGTGRVADWFFSPVTYYTDNGTPYIIATVDAVTLRAEFLKTDQVIQNAFDPYAFVRDGYLQRRNYLLHGKNQNAEQGAPPPWEQEGIAPPWEQQSDQPGASPGSTPPSTGQPAPQPSSAGQPAAP
jgi:phospholipid-binding lipoprotein MlaA